MSRRVLTLIILFLYNYNVQSSFCPTNWTYYSSKCYFFSSNDRTYNDAKDDCRTYGASLAIPNSADEFSFLNSTITSGIEYFLGLYCYTYMTKTFKAIDNSNSYQSWCSGEPNHGFKVSSYERCATLKSCGLNDKNCDNAFNYVCEKASCASNQHYESASESCESGLSYEDSCSTNSDCASSLNLTCQNGKCKCDTNLLWNGTICQTCSAITDWISYGSSCYYLGTSKMNYDKSKSFCSDKSSAATLAIPNSVDELSFLNSTRISGKTYFLGIYDFGDMDFAAVDNSTAYYSWCSGEPNNGAKDNNPEACVSLKDCGMNDSYCSTSNYFICEIQK